MKITQEEINFFKTFGYLRLKNVFSSSEVSFLDRHFSSYYNKFFRESFLFIKLKAILKGITCMVPSFADNQPEMMSLFLEKGLFDIPKQILGESVQYWGSDGSLFAYGSLWHRDTATLANRLKMNIYLNSGGKNTGAFRIIPGSQKMGDEYANNLSLACSWPGSSFAGGMSETRYLPATLSPRLNLFARIFKRKLADIPHQVIEFNVGDVLIFDDRALHCVYRPLYPKVRKLITLLFNEMSIVDRVHVSQKIDMTSTSINNELRILKQLECNQYNVPCYGAGVSEIFDKYNYSSYLSMLSDIAPNCESDYKGKHIPQSEDLAKFLTKNYFD
jgi:hypothetical protein